MPVFPEALTKFVLPTFQLLKNIIVLTRQALNRVQIDKN